MVWVRRGLLLLVISVAGAWLGAWGAGRALGAEASRPQERLAVAQRGDLVDSVSASGVLSLPHQEALSFGTAGTLAELLVAEGDQVRQGQALARLDTSTLASLRKSVAQARVSLRNAKDALEALKAGPAAASTQASLHKSVAQARVSLSNAKDALETLKAGPDTKALAAAQGRVATAQVGLDNAERDLVLARSDWETKLATATDQVRTSEDSYSRVFERYLGVVLQPAQRVQDPGALLASWRADLDALFNPWASAETAAGWLAQDPADDPATPWNESVLYAWRNFSPSRPAPATIRAEMDAAWEALDKARSGLATQQTQSAKALASAENALARARETLQTAQDDVATLREPPDADRVALAQAEVAAAQAFLANALEAEAKATPDADSVALAEAEVAAAQASLANALDREAKATLAAPFAGVVGSLSFKAGQSTAANAVIVTVVDPTEIQLQGAVNEADVARIQPGQEVSITLESLPGLTLQGRVITVALVGRTQQGVVSFPVAVQVQAARGVSLREGMTASATITAARQSGVILVPPRALRGTLAAPKVAVLSNGIKEERAVTISGLTTQSAAITAGLQPGDVLVIPASTGTALTNFQGAFRGFGAGGFGVPAGGGDRGAPPAGGAQRQR
ncbi:MAG: efflux RND transporter periplasmic adaptor subunit [Chloroflexi bacterium]|nr:efflux RND transporter periplasmic adaptor subunit [Chloroflexota bacterium]